MPVDQLKRIVFFETRRYLRDRMTWAGIAVFGIVMVIGAIDYWNSLPPRANGGRLFGEGYLFALSLAFHASLAQDRAVRFDIFLISNFVQPRVLYFGRILSAIVFLTGFAVVAFFIALISALGDVGYAAYYTSLFLTASFVLLPVVVLVELGVNTRHPVPLILALLFVLLAVSYRSGDLIHVQRWFGLDGELNAVSLVRSAIALAVTVALYPLYRYRIGLVR
jgi:hypothetical protein